MFHFCHSLLVCLPQALSHQFSCTCLSISPLPGSNPSYQPLANTQNLPVSSGAAAKPSSTLRSLYLRGVRATLCRGAQASCCSGFSCRGARALGALSLVVAACGPWRVGTVAVAHRLSCSLACGIFPDQGSNPCPLCWEVGSYPLSHKGSPVFIFVDAWHCLRHN